METIIIADGLTKEFLGTDQPFASNPGNIGRTEIDRLLGRGRAYGEGPLPAFLRATAQSASGESRMVLLKGEAPVPEILEPSLAHAELVQSPKDVIPWSDLWEAIDGGQAPEGEGGDRTPARRFVIVGCPTEGRILALATFLRIGLGYSEVAVSPHLAGSATREAHLSAFRHHFPRFGVRVFLRLTEAAEFCGVEDSSGLAALECHPPLLGPTETRDALSENQRRILELLCLNWTRADLRPLAGGFSGSLLLLANGWKGDAKTEPAVLKVDERAQMRRELEGYHRVKDFLGKHVPTFGYPVSEENELGVGMELAAMEGSPQTLQDAFEEAESDEGLIQFLKRLDKSLELLSDKLYRNARETTWVVPYRAFGLHTEQQARWLLQNGGQILDYLDGELPAEGRPEPEQLAKLLRIIAANPDGIESEICLGHGDLNYANIICDDVDNIWFIDWTHSDYAPVELDFAKLENDAKFVMSKMFDPGDLARLRLFEEYVLEQRVPSTINELPDRLKFVKWDLRYRKILETVRRIRRSCFGLKSSEDWLVYKVALLRYAAHTLSFDKRRERGECEPQQLMHALYAVEALIYSLVADDFHLRIRAERPSSYPVRQRISIDEAPWMLDCESYEPPYHVDETVLANDRERVEGGWADPEDFERVRDSPRIVAAKYKDEDGRPLNPRGRTGLQGRGLLGLWGPNLSIQALVVRQNPASETPEMLVGTTSDSPFMEAPRGFVLPDEGPEQALQRVLHQETGWTMGSAEAKPISEGYTYDSRQTDNAWVETRGYLVRGTEAPGLLSPGGDFDELMWRELCAETVNRLPSDQANLVREGIPHLTDLEILDQESADRLMASTG